MNIFPAIADSARPLIEDMVTRRGVTAPFPPDDMRMLGDLAAHAVEEAIRVLNEHTERATVLYGTNFGSGVGSLAHKALVELLSAAEEMMLEHVVRQMQANGDVVPSHVIAQLRAYRRMRQK